jgi:hypothetical protein
MKGKQAMIKEAVLKKHKITNINVVSILILSLLPAWGYTAPSAATQVPELEPDAPLDGSTVFLPLVSYKLAGGGGGGVPKLCNYQDVTVTRISIVNQPRRKGWGAML